ncbi:dephospho-CoA kinase, partial [Enterococcus faecium MRSN 4777]
HYDHYMDAVAVVYTTPETQLQRLMKRNQLTLEQAQQRISSQLPIEEKKQRADILFDNNGTKEILVGQIENWLFANRFL